jgi:hypothetical protein
MLNAPNQAGSLQVMMFEVHKPVNCTPGRLLPAAAGSAISFPSSP